MADYVEVFGIEVESDLTQLKLKVYRSVVLPTLLHACETWTVDQRHAKRLNHFHTSCLRKLLKIKWQYRIPDTEVLKRTGMQSVHTLLKFSQLRWTSHVTRMLNVYQRKSSMENYKLENAPMVVRRSETRTASKPPLKTSTYQQSRGNRFHRNEQSGEASWKGCWRIRSKTNQRRGAENGTTNRAFFLRPILFYL